jgi:DmsE family decaheme c-type cytochrome
MRSRPEDVAFATRSAAFAVALCGLVAAGAAAQDAAPSPAAGETVTAATCAECHDEVVAAFETSTHGRAWKHGDRDATATCTNCHGGAERHVESGDPADMTTPKELAPAAAAELCMTCHKENPEQAHWQGSAHQRRGVTCTDCHTLHAEPSSDSMTNAAMRSETCYRCHQDVRSEMRKVSHHPVREGKMTCLSCHNPHGTLTKANLRAGSVNELCYDCHTEKRGPFLWEHAPVRESCLNCHTPHGSNHLKLQSTSVPFLCQQCHSNTRHPGSLYDATRLPTLDNPTTGSNRLFNRACVDCHAAIHGSNHPSSPYLAH